MYRYALRPRWILSHLFVLFMVVLFVNLGLWQLRRHDERAERNATVEARAALDPVPVETLPFDDPETLRFRPVVAEGRYGDGTVLVDNRSLDGLPGVWVLEALRLGGGEVVMVNRGFAGYVNGELSIPDVQAGDVAVAGTAAPWDGRSCGTRTDDAGALEGMACLRRDAVEAELGEPVLPVVVQAAGPDVTPPLVAVPRPELGSGPHRGYAVQWFTFSIMVTGAYVLILRKVARERATDDLATSH